MHQKKKDATEMAVGHVKMHYDITFILGIMFRLKPKCYKFQLRVAQ